MAVNRREARIRRQFRARKKITGTADRPRLSVFRSANHIYAQLIDDVSGTTIAAASTLSPELKGMLTHGGNIESAQKVGELIAKKAKEKGVEHVVFDRGGNLYHGRVQALAESAREAGLDF